MPRNFQDAIKLGIIHIELGEDVRQFTEGRVDANGLAKSSFPNFGPATNSSEQTELIVIDRDNNLWISELCQRDSSAIHDLRALLLRNMRKAMADRPRVDDAFLEDSVQESLLRILDKLDQFTGRSRFMTWATSIAIRIAFSELRRSRWKDVSLEEIVAQGGFASEPIAPDKTSNSGSDEPSILAALQSLIDTELTDKQRQALLAELKGMPQDEIVRHLGSNRNAVYKLTHDARKKIRSGLESLGFTAADLGELQTV